MNPIKKVLKATVQLIKHGLLTLLAYDFMFRLITVSFLGSLASATLLIFMNLQGHEVLSDFEIARFVLSPIGIIGTVVVVALSLGVVLLEISFLLLIFYRIYKNESVRFLNLVSEILSSSKELLKLSFIFVATVVLVLAPFLFGIYLFALPLISQHDIYFYINSQPIEFTKAIIISGAFILAGLVTLISIVTPWIFSPLLILFQNLNCKQALKESKSLTKGKLKYLLALFISWLVSICILSTLISFAGSLVIGFCINFFQGSISVLVLALGIIFLANLIISFLWSFLVFASGCGILFNSYLELSNKKLQVKANEKILFSPLAKHQKTSVAFILIISLATFILLAYFLNNTSAHKVDTLVIAHRGSSYEAPENTLAAIQLSIDDGSDYIEIDVQESKDGKIMVIHDRDLKRLASHSTPIHKMTAKEIQSFDVGTWFDPKFADQRVPTLQEAIKLTKGKAKLLVELKYNGNDVDLANRTLRILREEDVYNNSSIMSLELRGVQETRELDPNFNVGFLSNVSLSNLMTLDVDHLSVSMNIANLRFIRRAQGNGYQVYVWTVNDPKQMLKFLDYKIDGIITDKPKLLHEMMREMNNLNIAERIILRLAFSLGIDLERFDR